MTLGIVVAKDNSKRFPGKNKYLVDNKPLFWHSVEPLLESKNVDDVVVVTDSKFISNYCFMNEVKVIDRPKNATRDEDKLINIIRFGYYNLSTEYDTVVSVMANCPGNSVEDIDDAINLLHYEKLREVRSFDSTGKESGILVLSKSIIQSNSDISYYQGSIQTLGKEIHYKEDLI